MNSNRSRRSFLRLAAGAAALPGYPRVSSANDYPDRPVRLMVGFAAGGAPDIVARLHAQWLSERLGQPFVVENRPGADGNIATGLFVRAAPDGYTLFQITLANAVNPMLYGGPNYMEDIVPVASVASAAFVVATLSTSPLRTIADVVAFAKANPRKLNMGSAGSGTPPYLSGTMFKQMTGVDILQIPHRNSLAAINELLAGRLDLIISDMSAIGFIKAGKLRALAVTTAKRQDLLPDVPAMAEVLPGFEATTWYGIAVTKNTPPVVVTQLNAATNAALADPDKKSRLTSLGFNVTARSPAEYAAFVTAETAKWSKVILAAGLRPQ